MDKIKGTKDKCAYCDDKPEYVCLVEADENPHNSNLEYVCYQHELIVKKISHEIWTLEEWLSNN